MTFAHRRGRRRGFTVDSARESHTALALDARVWRAESAGVIG